MWKADHIFPSSSDHPETLPWLSWINLCLVLYESVIKNKRPTACAFLCFVNHVSEFILQDGVPKKSQIRFSWIILGNCTKLLAVAEKFIIGVLWLSVWCSMVAQGSHEPMIITMCKPLSQMVDLMAPVIRTSTWHWGWNTEEWVEPVHLERLPACLSRNFLL